MSQSPPAEPVLLPHVGSLWRLQPLPGVPVEPPRVGNLPGGPKRSGLEVPEPFVPVNVPEPPGTVEEVVVPAVEPSLPGVKGRAASAEEVRTRVGPSEPVLVARVSWVNAVHATIVTASAMSFFTTGPPICMRTAERCMPAPWER